VLLAQIRFQTFEQRASPGFPEPQRLGGGRNDQLRIPDRGQRDEANTVRVVIRKIVRDPQG
jgi:hypothetical protein